MNTHQQRTDEENPCTCISRLCAMELKRMEESDIMSDQKDQRTMIPSTGLEDLHLEYQFQHCRLSTQDQNYAQQPSIHKYSFYVVLFTFFFEAIRYTEYLTINSLYN